MDALLSALVAALLSQSGDRTPWLVARLADRTRHHAALIAAAVVAIALGNGLAGLGATLLRPSLTHNAATLLLALACLFAAIAAAWRVSPPRAQSRWRLGVATPFLTIFVVALGDSAQFMTFAIAARSPHPAYAVLGATLGCGAHALVAATLGERRWRALPLGWFRRGGGVAFLVVALILAFAALSPA